MFLLASDFAVYIRDDQEDYIWSVDHMIIFIGMFEEKQDPEDYLIREHQPIEIIA